MDNKNNVTGPNPVPKKVKKFLEERRKYKDSILKDKKKPHDFSKDIIH